MNNIYLDNAALEKPQKDIIDNAYKMQLEFWYNPNAYYENAKKTKVLIENTKKIISTEINCKTNELIFCSCASEANSLAICGYLRKNNKKHFITSTIEHASILENIYGKKIITVDQYGFYNLEKIKKINNSLVSLQIANSEIGTIQNIKMITKILHKNNCVVHTDATAIFGKIKIDVNDLGVDMLTATGQKIGSLLGAAFLFKKNNIDIEPLIFGHDTLRGGTPNTIAIASLGQAIQKINYTNNGSKNRDYVYNYIINNIPDTYLVGADFEYRLPHNLYMCFKDISGESLMTLLDMQHIQVSTGSACSSGSKLPSPTLAAINMDNKDIYSCIRLTFSGNETQEELDYVCIKIKECVECLRTFT